MWLNTGMLELTSEVINQEGEKRDGKEERTEIESQGDVVYVGKEDNPWKQTTLLLFLAGPNPAGVFWECPSDQASYMSQSNNEFTVLNRA